MFYTYLHTSSPTPIGYRRACNARRKFHRIGFGNRLTDDLTKVTCLRCLYHFAHPGSKWRNVKDVGEQGEILTVKKVWREKCSNLNKNYEHELNLTVDLVDDSGSFWGDRFIGDLVKMHERI